MTCTSGGHVVVLNFRDCRERDLHDLPARDLDLHARCGERLGGLHASHCPTHAPAVRRNNLHIVLAIKRLERCECLGNFHSKILPVH